MRYTVKYIDGLNIVNAISTDQLSSAISEEQKLKLKYSQVWIADAVQEIIVG